MLTSASKKIKLLSLVEPNTLVRRLLLKVNNDWQPDSFFKQNLIVNHDYRFLYCPIHKNASTSMMAALLQLAERRSGKSLQTLPDLQMRLYIGLNYSLAGYSQAMADRLINSDYFKFAIVRNPWVRLFSTYSNYFIRLPIEKGIVSGIAKDASRYLYGDDRCEQYNDSITFEQFVDYVSAKTDSQLDLHCVSQSKFLGEVKYDYIARMETLNEDIKRIENKIGISFGIGQSNKSSYTIASNSAQDFSQFEPNQIRALEGGIPNCKSFYTSALASKVKDRYREDVESFDYTFSL